MSTVAGLPAHILLNHFVVVLMPLIAILLIICALWPAARQRLVWLVLILAALTAVVTPLTVGAGEWLGDRADQSPELDRHMNFGETGSYFAVALLVAAVLLAVLHVRLARGHAVQPVVRWVVAVAVIAVAGATMFQIHRIGESGARAAWGSCCQ
ncbi:MAG TPA: hypothetical protein VFR27_16260 [Mycobacterium sp.]|nr:hypothetical protein [Mycobacterium sp.]